LKACEEKGPCLLDDKLEELHWIEKWEPRGEGYWFLTQHCLKVTYFMEISTELKKYEAKFSCEVKSRSPT